MCTFDVLGNLNGQRPEASYLFHLLLEYAVSEELQPKVEVDLERLLKR